MPSVAWAYNGSDTLTATVTGASIGVTYSLWTNSPPFDSDTQVAASTTVVLTITDLAPTSGLTFDVIVQKGAAFSADDYVGATVFQQGSTSEYTRAVTWSFDGNATVTATLTTTVGVNYLLQLLDSTHGGSTPTTWTGSGASEMKTVSYGSPATGTYFYAFLYEPDTGNIIADRLFTAGAAGAGTGGNPSGASPAPPAAEGVCLAFDDPTLEPSPTWTRLDDGVTRVASYSIERGRRFELDRTDGGRATISINDVDGTLDPTNSSGPYYGLIQPLIQASISRWDPVLEEWQMRFRGFVEDFDYDFDKSQRVNRLTISLVDIFEILNSIEMLPGSFGDAPPSEVNGQIFFDNANVDDRIRQVYGDAALPDDFFVVFSGNVTVHETVYAPGETALAAIQEAVDAEFPSVSNFYPDRFGRAVFHGRLAKFDPHGTWLSIAGTDAARDAVWSFREWKAGDGAAIVSSPSDTAQIRDFGFNRGLGMIRNQAFATPKRELTDTETSGQIVTDSVSVGTYGIRSWSAPQLLTETGLLDASDDLTETARFAQYIVDNYKDPHNRINKIAFRPLRPDDPRAAANWKLLCQVDIADSIKVTIASPGGGGFDLEPCFVEGVHEEVTSRLLADGQIFDDVTVTLDLSPQAVFTQNPFPTS